MSAFIEWRDNWLLDIDDMDGEHKELVDMLNQLAERYCCVQRSGAGGVARRDKIVALLDDIGRHVKSHFDHEEACMSEAGYPGYEAHCYEHVTLLAEYAELMREVRREGVECLDQDTLGALKGWLIGHIAGADRRFGDYYRSTVLGAHPLPDIFTRRWIQRSIGSL